MYGLAIFPTLIGWAGLAWGDEGLAGVHLPEEDADRTRRRLKGRFPEAVESAPPPDLARVADAIAALLAGEASDLSFTPLDLARTPAFNRKVYALARAIPRGRTRTYGDIAIDLGNRLAARAVGKALGENPWPIVVPCHRVLAAGGKIGGFSANGGVVTKARLLAIEGARTNDEPGLFDGGSTFSLAPLRR